MHVVSTMGSGKLGRELHLPSVIEALDKEFGIEATSHSDGMATIRLEEDGPALTLYRTGTFQIRGTESKKALFEAKEELLAALRAIGLPFEESTFDQNNTVYLDDLETEVQLEALALSLGLENTEYEPEQFPGVIYRLPDIGTVMLIFASGKTIISGTTSDKIARKSATHLREMLEELD